MVDYFTLETWAQRLKGLSERQKIIRIMIMMMMMMMMMMMIMMIIIIISIAPYPKVLRRFTVKVNTH